MTNLLSASQLRKAATIADKIEKLQAELVEVLGIAPKEPTTSPRTTKPKRRMSAAGKARIAAAQKARWAKQKQKSGK